ncbi:NUMOD4 domain-containing protein [Tenacibaculum sp.]|uniref:NUMOD4 domain-containing protein n=1 Tax=Tenacibaculum sp. TaxID=1906242 RepID=UPI003D1072C1
MFKPVPGFEGLYEVSKCGRIRSTYKEVACSSSLTGIRRLPTKEKTLTNDGKGYLITRLSKGKKSRNYFVHQIVALAYIDNPNNLKVINHKDGNPLNNNVNNLEWCTQKYNIQHAYDNDLRKTTPVIQLDLEGSLLKEHKSIKAAAEHIGKPKASGDIHHCCTGHKNRKIAYGYKWKYKK